MVAVPSAAAPAGIAGGVEVFVYYVFFKVIIVAIVIVVVVILGFFS